MPAMTMSYPVSPVKLMEGRLPGELIAATLEVRDYSGTLVDITHVGSAPLPETNEAAFAAGILGVGDQAPDAALIDQTDTRRSFSEWKGTVTLVTFIYTRCPLPNFCPLMDQNFSTIQRALAKEDALRGKVKLLSVTFDPDHDTPQILADHAARVHADPAVWTFLTGDKPTLDRFAAKFGVSLIRESDQAKTITHSLQTTLLDPNHRVVKMYRGNDWTPGAVLGDIRSLVK
jgi:protein SCO1/2